MSATIRDFNNFHNFGGYIKNKCYEFPVVNTIDSAGRSRSWIIKIRLISNDTKTGRRSINWDIKTDIVIPIKNLYLDGKSIPAHVIAQIWTEQGINHADAKITRSSPTYIIKGKNIGKKNETNVFTQALILARSKYLKKKEFTSNNRYYPVAVHKYEDNPRAIKNKIIYPVAVQRKINGGRVVSYKDDEVVMYTRKLKNIDGNQHIANELKLLFSAIESKYTNIYLDGEFYKHGLTLQDISGKMRRSEQVDNELLEYHLFDLFFPLSDTSLPFEARNKILRDIFDIVQPLNLQYIKRVETYIADIKEENKLYELFLTEQYEGSVLKNLYAPYEFGRNKEIRTYQMRKRKPRYSNEYEIVGYTQGDQGKDIGAIIWVLKTAETKKNKSTTFTSIPIGITNEERYKLFSDMTDEIFNNVYKGKMMTVEYDELSEIGVPLRAKVVGIRLIE